PFAIDGWIENWTEDGPWHHYAFVKNEDTKEIWIDGELVQDGINTATLPSDIVYLNIGGNDLGFKSLEGIIDDFAVFASALNESQIVALAGGDRSILPSTPSYPALVSTSPNGLDRGVATVEAILYKRVDELLNPQISINGQPIDTNVTTEGKMITLTGTLPNLDAGNVLASVSYNGVSSSWTFKIASIYKNAGEVPSVAQGGLTVREYKINRIDPLRYFHQRSLDSLFEDKNFPDNPHMTTTASYFEWPQSGNIEIAPENDVNDNYGWHLMGYIHPPETGEYIFAVASDDNSQLWLSTDSDPANAVQLTNESKSVGFRQFQPQRDESTSKPVYLEAGKAYFIECYAMEGTGGDRMTVAWSLPSEGPSDVIAGALPISGEYLSPFISIIDEDNQGQNSRPIQKISLQPLTLEEMSNNPFSFSYNTVGGKTYIVECSTDLIRWYEVDLVKGTGSEVKFTDKRQRLFRQQFYRVQAKE
ncbi:MAG: hypothetical protein HOH33_02390, partial [Verrucomicrobia bacterium]|nr:hypothetical protein [Verrucomicrobiota bacterium]